MTPLHPQRAPGGFTMIEIALALVVLSVGLLSMVTLLGSGVQRQAEAQDETHAALFAGSVFNALRADSLLASAQPELGAYTNFWDSFTIGATGVTVAVQAFWIPDDMTIRAGALFTNVYLNAPDPERGAAESGVVNHVLRYRMDVTPASASAWNDRRQVYLYVWPGAFGPTHINRGYVFYSEFDDSGDL